MACSKELQFPKEWLKYHHDSVNEAVDPELFDEEEFFKWIVALGLCDRHTAKKYNASVKPYHFMRYMVEVVPNNSLCRELFQLWTNLTGSIFVSDDKKETFSQIEMRQLCDAFQMLDRQLCEQFPRLPTLAEMKQSLRKKGTDEKLIPQVLELMDFTNSVAKSILQKGNFAEDDVRDFWRRLCVSFALYIEACKTESSTCVVPEVEIVWRRTLSGGPHAWLHILEVTSGAIGKVRAHVPLINELYILSGFFCMTVNDIYSHEKEMSDGTRVTNTVRIMAESKEVSGEAQAALKAVRILNSITKVMYQKIEKAKEENPDNAEFCTLLDNIGMATGSWYFFHHFSPRYEDTLWRLTVVGVEQEKLEEWKRCTDEELPDQVKHLLQHSSPKANQISDYIISGVINIHANLLPA